MLAEKEVVTIDDFVDVVIQTSRTMKDWKTDVFMKVIHNKILQSTKSNTKVVNAQVAMGYFHLYALLPSKSSQDRIQASALSMRDWIKGL